MGRLRGVDGTRWALLRRVDIPDLLDETQTYLTRWRVIQCPWGGVFLHAIRLPDRDRHLHDHPWGFVGLILRGGYTERVAEGGGQVRRRWRRGSIHRLRATDAHAIETLHDAPVWTLLLVGPRHRDWGYWTETGWVRHEAYHAHRRTMAGAR